MWRNTEATVHERRRSTRYATSGIVQVQDVIGGALHDCRLTDISEGGVRLYAERLAVPDEFHIWISSENIQRLRCRVVWRLGHEVGAEFVGRARPESARGAAMARFGSR